MQQLEMSHTVPEKVTNSFDFTLKWMPCSSEPTIREMHTKRFKGAYVILYSNVICLPCLWVRYHSMVRPQIADGGMASDMEGSCE